VKLHSKFHPRHGRRPIAFGMAVAASGAECAVNRASERDELDANLTSTEWCEAISSMGAEPAHSEAQAVRSSALEDQGM
jgi:hypothetical protein